MTKPAKPSPIYNPAEKEGRTGLDAKVWELLRRNKEFKDRVLEIVDSVASLSDPFAAQDVLMKSVDEERDIVMRDLIRNLLSCITLRSTDNAGSFPHQLKPFSGNLELDWANLPKINQDRITDAIGPRKILPDSLLQTLLMMILKEVDVSVVDPKDVHTKRVEAENEHLNRISEKLPELPLNFLKRIVKQNDLEVAKKYLKDISSRYFLFAVPRTYMTRKKINIFTSEIKEFLIKNIEINPNKLQQGHFGKIEQWRHYLAFEEVYYEGEGESENGGPSIYLFGLYPPEFRAYCIDAWKGLYPKATEKTRQKRISEFRKDVKDIQYLTFNIYPNFCDLLDKLSKKA